MEENQMTINIWRRLKKLTDFREFMVLMAVIFLALFIYSFNQKFFGAYNIQGILRQVAIFGLLGIAETAVIITAGIDLSPGSMLAFNGVMVAMLMSQGVGFVPAIIIVLAVCAIIGLYHGFLITRIGLPPFIATLGSLSIFRGIAVVSTKGYPIPIKNEAFLWLGQEAVFGIPVPFIILVIVGLAIHYLLTQTAIGRHIYAIGGNPEAARLSGIPVKRVLTSVYILATVLFGISAIIMAGRLGQGMPGVGVGYELNAIAAAIIGGTSLAGGVETVLGTIIGAALMALIDNLLILLRVESWWNELIIGFVIVLAVTVDMITAKRRISA
jgi:ribose transport system permease protein